MRVHNYKYLRKEAAYISETQKSGDIIFFDDYNLLSYPGVVKAVDEFCDIYSYSKHLISASPERNYIIAIKK